MPAIAKSKIGRSLLLVQFSTRASKLPPQLVLDEMRSFAATASFDALLRNLAWGEQQKGMPANSIKKPLVIGWGTKDRVCLPRQAYRAKRLFPDAQLYWCNGVGHFPHWDAPQQTVALILKVTA
jgi:pimeloyl-ACP methyl ester carboxylesterase